jgi:hypothetical protein
LEEESCFCIRLSLAAADMTGPPFLAPAAMFFTPELPLPSEEA